MALVVYPGEDPVTASQMVSFLGQHGWWNGVEVCSSLLVLMDRLLQVPISCEVLIAVAEREDLDRLSTVWKRLLAPKLILVLRTWEEATVKQAFRFCPSFLTSLEGGLTDVALVLEKLEVARSGMPSDGAAPMGQPDALRLVASRHRGRGRA